MSEIEADKSTKIAAPLDPIPRVKVELVIETVDKTPANKKKPFTAGISLPPKNNSTNS